MYVTAFCSQKGGSGKTTLSGHLAVQAERAGAGPVALVDCDPQGSLSSWWNARESSQPAFLRTTLGSLAADLERLAKSGFRHVVIDTPPAISAPILKVIAQSDLVLIPTRPSPHDLRAVTGTLELAERAEKPIVFVLNGAAPRARITSDAAVALSQHGTVAPTFVHHKTVMASAMIDGRTAMEVLPNSRSAEEIAELWRYVADRFQRMENRRRFQQAHRPAARAFGRRSIESPATADAAGEGAAGDDMPSPDGSTVSMGAA